MAINKVILLGNLGKDPELRYTAQHTPVCLFSLATGERRKGSDGNWSEHTEWHHIVAFGSTAENCNKYLKKGRQAFIEGKVHTRKWQDKGGKDRYTTEILAHTVQFVGGARAEKNGEGEVKESEVHSILSTEGEPGELSFEDDDIPF